MWFCPSGCTDFQLFEQGQKCAFSRPVFAKEKKKIPVMKVKRSYQSTKSVQEQGIDVQSLQKRVKELEAQLSRAEMKAKFYDKMIDIAEAKFKISIRKKSGAKQ